jgi:hypothetical protein
LKPLLIVSLILNAAFIAKALAINTFLIAETIALIAPYPLPSAIRGLSFSLNLLPSLMQKLSHGLLATD